MPALPIRRMGDPVLRLIAEPVADPTAPEVAALVRDMFESMEAADGIGLAAPQIGVSKRVVIFHVPDEDAPGNDSETRRATRANRPLVLINPEIEILDPAQEDGFEGCLSVPGLTGLVPRYVSIRYRGLAPSGETIERAASGFHARVVQHECDHLDGVLYPERMRDLKTLIFTSEIHRLETPPSDDDLA